MIQEWSPTLYKVGKGKDSSWLQQLKILSLRVWSLTSEPLIFNLGHLGTSCYLQLCLDRSVFAGKSLSKFTSSTVFILQGKICSLSVTFGHLYQESCPSTFATELQIFLVVIQIRQAEIPESRCSHHHPGSRSLSVQGLPGPGCKLQIFGYVTGIVLGLFRFSHHWVNLVLHPYWTVFG